MVEGRLAALDTPESLKKTHIKGALYKLEGRDLSTALKVVRGLEGVLDAHPFGAGAHLRLDPTRMDGKRLSSALEKNGIDRVTIVPIEPTLEDVFLAVVEPRA
jgi:ABC-2 type transport system ATP-binding protein